MPVLCKVSGIKDGYGISGIRPHHREGLCDKRDYSMQREHRNQKKKRFKKKNTVANKGTTIMQVFLVCDAWKKKK